MPSGRHGSSFLGWHSLSLFLSAPARPKPRQDASRMDSSRRLEPSRSDRGAASTPPPGVALPRERGRASKPRCRPPLARPVPSPRPVIATGRCRLRPMSARVARRLPMTHCVRARRSSSSCYPEIASATARTSPPRQSASNRLAPALTATPKRATPPRDPRAAIGRYRAASLR